MGAIYPIKLVGVTKYYPGICALNDINLQIEKGSVHGLIGPNGAGKSTCMKIMAGHLVPEMGEVLWFGKKQRPLIGLLPDQVPFYPTMRIEDYLYFVATIHGLFSKEAKESVLRALKSCALREIKSKRCDHLSTGQKQKLGVAQALVIDPEIIILDEPTSGLDPLAVIEMRDLIRQLAQLGKTIILSTHLLHEVEQICSHVSFILDGKIESTSSLLSLTEQTTDASLAFALEIENQSDAFYDEMIKELSPRQFHIRKEINDSAKIILIYQEMNNRIEIQKKISHFFMHHNCPLLSFSIEKQKVEMEKIYQNKAQKSDSLSRSSSLNQKSDSDNKISQRPV